MIWKGIAIFGIWGAVAVCAFSHESYTILVALFAMASTVCVSVVGEK